MNQINDVDDVVIKNKTLSETEIITHLKIRLRSWIEISQYLTLKYNKNENAININEQNEIDFIIKQGLIIAKQNLFSNKSSLLHKEKEPRKDVWKKLGKIAYELIQYNSYPKISSFQLQRTLNKVLRHRDHRVIQDYQNTILTYCNNTFEKGSNFGELDVSFFVSLIPKQFIEIPLETSSTSFSYEND